MSFTPVPMSTSPTPTPSHSPARVDDEATQKKSREVVEAAATVLWEQSGASSGVEQGELSVDSEAAISSPESPVSKPSTPPSTVDATDPREVVTAAIAILSPGAAAASSSSSSSVIRPIAGAKVDGEIACSALVSSPLKDLLHPGIPGPLVDELLGYLATPTAWHFVAKAKAQLEKSGFKELALNDPDWKIEAGQRYLVTKNGSSLFAFVTPKETPRSAAIVAAHTDSPALWVNPHPKREVKGMELTGVSGYGGLTQPSWVGPDLALAGSIIIETEDGELEEHLVHIDKLVGSVEIMPPHIDGSVSTDLHCNMQTTMAPTMYTLKNDLKLSAVMDLLKTDLRERGIDFTSISSYELFFVPLQKPGVAPNGTVRSYRMDNILGSTSALQGILANLEPGKDRLKVIALFDNEEVGSLTAQGARSCTIENLMARICKSYGMSKDERRAMYASSLLASNDVAHALNPRHTGKFEPSHTCEMGEGIVLKINQNQRYITDRWSSAIFHKLCGSIGVKSQDFIIRADGSCGSTVGPFIASRIGLKGFDYGVPIQSMHSTRETCSQQDYKDSVRFHAAFFSDAWSFS